MVPVFNERDTVLKVLEHIEQAGFGPIVVVDDGSTDGSSELLVAWSQRTAVGRLITLEANVGKSAALKVVWESLRADLEVGRLSTDTKVICVDADGQHDLHYLRALMDRMDDMHADAIIARRDFTYHTLYKRSGNHLMALLGSVCAGTRFHDIESGYRILRLGALLHAQEFYLGRRYSEGVELAVVLGRLGYRVDNDYVVEVPVPRTRTKLRDAAYHAIVMLLAWYRVLCWKDLPRERRSVWGATLAFGLFVAFAGYLGVVLDHRMYLGDDSAQSYGHVWFISHSLLSGEGNPLHIPSLSGGRAFTFQYALIPWLPAALLRPLLGDFVVTLTMVLGVLLLLFALARWLPRLGSPLVMALVLVNWQLWNAILQFQLPTIWALAFACLAAAEFDRDRPLRGGVLAVAALFAHPLMGATALAMTQVANVEATRRVPWRRAPWLLGAAVVAAPAIWTFLHLPALGEVMLWGMLTPLQILLQRSSMVWWPWVAQRFYPRLGRYAVPLLFVLTLLLVRNFAGSNPKNARWQSLPRFPDFFAAGKIDPAASYRVLTMSNQEDGMIQLMQAGGHLAQDFFDESIQRRSFGNVEAYRCFLASRGATHVLVNAEWIHQDKTDEVRLLGQLAERGGAELVYRGSAGTLDYALQPVSADACVKR